MSQGCPPMSQHINALRPDDQAHPAVGRGRGWLHVTMAGACLLLAGMGQSPAMPAEALEPTPTERAINLPLGTDTQSDASHAVVPTARAQVIADDRARWAALAAEAEQKEQLAVRGTGAWLFFAGELRHLGVGRFWGEAANQVSMAIKPANRDPMPAIVDFNTQLAKLGITLILVPVPPKAAVHVAESLGQPAATQPTRVDPDHQAFYQLLGEQGVTVLDLTDLYLTHPQPANYLQTDSHWSSAGVVRAAEAIGARIQAMPALAHATTQPAYDTRTLSLAITGDLLPPPPEAPEAPAPEALTTHDAPNATEAGRETIQVMQVGRWKHRAGVAGGDDAPQHDFEMVSENEQSPVLVLGDSHVLVFHLGGDMHATGGGISDQLTRVLGLPVETMGVRGSGATPARISLIRKARSDPAWLKNKRVVVWVFAAREFTQSTGWSTLTIFPE